MVANSQEPRQTGKTFPVSNLSGYKGGLPFYTAFHQKYTTRLLLLKTTEETPELKKYLRITDSQSGRLKNLQLFSGGTPSDVHRSKLLDENIAFDEELIDPEFYSFLDVTQRELLDRVAIEFDGSSGLSRVSIANRLVLSNETRDAIAGTLVKYRKELFLPYFRHCFAAKLSEDHEFRDCEFSGRYLALLDQAILEHLSRAERKRYEDWITKTSLPDSVVDAIKRKAPLPKGLVSLAAPDGD